MRDGRAAIRLADLLLAERGDLDETTQILRALAALAYTLKVTTGVRGGA